MLKNTLIATLLATAVTLPAFAQGASTPKLDQRLDNQEHRIEQGEASGQLTHKEAAHLERHEAKIRSDLGAAKADGKVTAQERTRIAHEENRQNKRIHHKKHNARHQ